MNLPDLKARRAEATAEAEKIINDAMSSGVDLKGPALARYNVLLASIKDINAKIEWHANPRGQEPGGVSANMRPTIIGEGRAFGGRASQKPMSPEYTESFMALLRSGGKQATAELTEGFDRMFGGYAVPQISNALYKGSNSAGGYGVSIPTDDQIVPLGMPDLGVRSLARAIETETDVKIPTQASFGTAGIKAESGASAVTFAESDPSLSQFTLGAFMVGLTHTVSWELLQDVELFQSFGIGDLFNAISIAEDGFFVSGNGTTQPQGLLGNVGTGTAAAYAVESTGAYLLQSTLDVVGTLKANYHPNAAWLMSRATATAIRKAQMQTNIFAPAWTRENGRDFLWGYR
jgi:HK97 family phage major capsid protein